MAIVLTTEEIKQLKAQKEIAESAAITFNQAAVNSQARAEQYAVVDGAFKKFFDQYNDKIIAKYDLERRKLDGTYIASPISETDIQETATLSDNRIQPTLPQTDVVRIDEFDGGNTIVDPNNETQNISDQASIESTLQFGYGGSSPGGTVSTTTSIDANSTSLQLTSSTTYSISPGTTLMISTGGDFALVKVLTFVMQVSPVPPPYIANCTIEVVVAPSGIIPSGQVLLAFNGFSNGERTSKTASDSDYQGLMNYLIDQLELEINSRISNLNDQLSAIFANEDEEGLSEFSVATTNINTSKNFLTNYLITTNISNAGLASLAAERSIRSPQIVSRVAEIENAYTGRSLNYYDQRYLFANNRANTSRGILRLQKAEEQSVITSQNYAQGLTDQAEAIGNILP